MMKNVNCRKKNVLITGGTSGLGLELVKMFIENGFIVITTGRRTINIPGSDDKFRLFPVDFSDLTQLAITIKTILHSIDHFDIIINNAGILGPPNFTKTTNGYEYTLQVNFLSHLLINEIILRKTYDADPLMIAAVTSPVYRLVDINSVMQAEEKSYIPVKAYASSKLCLNLMCEFLPARYPGKHLQCFSFDPGTFNSGIYRMQKKWFRSLYRIASPFMRNPGQVAKILTEIIINEEVENGMICNIRKRSWPIQEIDEQRKEYFLKYCYDRIDPFLK